MNKNWGGCKQLSCTSSLWWASGHSCQLVVESLGLIPRVAFFGQLNSPDSAKVTPERITILLTDQHCLIHWIFLQQYALNMSNQTLSKAIVAPIEDKLKLMHTHLLFSSLAIFIYLKYISGTKTMRVILQWRLTPFLHHVWALITHALSNSWYTMYQAPAIFFFLLFFWRMNWCIH